MPRGFLAPGAPWPLKCPWQGLPRSPQSRLCPLYTWGAEPGRGAVSDSGRHPWAPRRVGCLQTPPPLGGRGAPGVPAARLCAARAKEGLRVSRSPHGGQRLLPRVEELGAPPWTSLGGLPARGSTRRPLRRWPDGTERTWAPSPTPDPEVVLSAPTRKSSAWSLGNGSPPALSLPGLRYHSSSPYFILPFQTWPFLWGFGSLKTI